MDIIGGAMIENDKEQSSVMGCDQTGEGSSNEQQFGEEKSMLRITNVPKKIDTETLKKEFEQHGQVSDVKLDKESGTCFLSYACQEDAKKAIDVCHNKLILPGGERPIIVVFQKSLLSLGKKFENLRKLEGRKKKSTGNENVDDKNIDQEITDLKDDIFETIAIGSSQSLFDLAALVAEDRSNGEHNLPQNDIDMGNLTLESARDRIMNKLRGVEYKVGTDGAS